MTRLASVPKPSFAIAFLLVSANACGADPDASGFGTTGADSNADNATTAGATSDSATTSGEVPDDASSGGTTAGSSTTDDSGGGEPAQGYVCTLATGATATEVFPAIGAVPDDDEDDFAAIQDALDAAGEAGGGVVALPAGTFISNGHLQMRSNVTLTGVGPETIIEAGPGFLDATGPAGGYPIITTDGANDVTIANLTADQSGDTLDGNIAGRLTEYLIDVRHSRNALVDGVHTRNPFTYSIAIVASSEFCVIHSNTLVATSGLYDQLDGIHILDSHTGEVLENEVDQRMGADGDDGLVAHSIGAVVHDVLYAGNRVRGGSHGAGMQIALGDVDIHGLRIENNLFWGSPVGLHTGFYESDTGSVYDITVGGSPTTGNRFEDNDGDAVVFDGNLENIVVMHNVACNSGAFIVEAAPGNQVEHNDTECGS